MAEIGSQLTARRSGYGQIVTCPSCLQEALKADCDVSCAFCGYAAPAEEAAELYIATAIGVTRHYCDKEGEEYPLWNCPNCGNKALVFEEGYSEVDGICFACGATPSPGEYKSCDQCHELCPAENRVGGQCLDSIKAYIAEDHT